MADFPEPSLRSSPFLRLPVELRLEVYKYLFPLYNRKENDYEKGWYSDWVVDYRELDANGRYRQRIRGNAHTAILRTNKQIHTEALDVLFHGSVFRVQIYPRGIVFMRKLYISSKALTKGFGFVRPEKLAIQINHSESGNPKDIVEIRNHVITLCQSLKRTGQLPCIDVEPAWMRWYNDHTNLEGSYFIYETEEEPDEGVEFYEIGDQQWGQRPYKDCKLQFGPRPAWALDIWNPLAHHGKLQHTLFSNVSDLELVLQPFSSLRNIEQPLILGPSGADENAGTANLLKNIGDNMMTRESAVPLDDVKIMRWTKAIHKRLQKMSKVIKEAERRRISGIDYVKSSTGIRPLWLNDSGWERDEGDEDLEELHD